MVGQNSHRQFLAKLPRIFEDIYVSKRHRLYAACTTLTQACTVAYPAAYSGST
jgi:hypothetical protein